MSRKLNAAVVFLVAAATVGAASTRPPAGTGPAPVIAVETWSAPAPWALHRAGVLPSQVVADAASARHFRLPANGAPVLPR